MFTEYGIKIIFNSIVKHKLRQKNKRSANSQHKKRKAHTIVINNRFFMKKEERSLP
jgi:hypothetical protein